MNERFLIIKNWILFTYNYPRDFIDKCWNDEKYLIDHLKYKFEEKCNYNMNLFFCELDTENQEKLVNWAINNYFKI